MSTRGMRICILMGAVVCFANSFIYVSRITVDMKYIVSMVACLYLLGLYEWLKSRDER